MSDGRIDGDFIPEVQRHRQLHPEAEHAADGRGDGGARRRRRRERQAADARRELT